MRGYRWRAFKRKGASIPIPFTGPLMKAPLGPTVYTFPFACRAKRSRRWRSCLVVAGWEVYRMEMVHIYPLPTLRPSLRQRHMALGQIARKRQRCQKGSRRWRKLQRARPPGERAHPAADPVPCVTRGPARSSRFVSSIRWQSLHRQPRGVRRRHHGRHHNQRLSGWEYGRDIAYLVVYKPKSRQHRELHWL